MKSCKRFFSVFSCFVLLFAVFSLPVRANAAEIGLSSYHWYASSSFDPAGTGYGMGALNIYVNDGTEQKVHNQFSINQSSYSAYSDWWVHKHFTIAHDNSSILFSGGQLVTLKVSNVYYETQYFYVNSSGSTELLDSDSVPDRASARFVYNDGSYDAVESISFTHRNGTSYIDLSIQGTPSKDVAKVWIILEKDVDNNLASTAFNNGSDLYIEEMIGEWAGDGSFTVKVDQQSEEAEKLGGILGWVENIGNKLSDMFDTVSYGFANIVDMLTNLPAKIWEFIENGLKGLFVPDDQYMISYKDKWDELLSERLGAVYEVGVIATDSWGNIMAADQTNTIAMPLVTIPLPEDNSFSFGGYDVQIVPEGVEVLVEAVKLAIGILCTYLFINGLLKRYEEVMGVEK